jgi:hypothetical protein
MYRLTLMFFSLCILLPGTAKPASFGLDTSSSQILIVGPIVPGDYDRFANLLRHTSADVGAVDIISPGGNVQEALKIGRLIRMLSFSTNAPSTEAYAPEARQLVCSQARQLSPTTPCTCASACFLIWAGGVFRSGNDIYIHRIAFDKTFYGSLSPSEAHSKYTVALAEVRDYLKEMEIPDTIYEEMVRMPSYAVTPLEEANSLWTPPSFGEWLTARCGPPQARVDSTCELREGEKAAADGLRKFRTAQ